jgi:Ca-activated chloride channel family protein
MFRLAYPDLLPLFLLLPVLLVLYLIMRRQKKIALAKFGDEKIIRKLFPDVSITRPGIKFVLLLIASVFFIAGLCGPLIGSRLEEVKRKGADIIIALDVSNSMLAEDLKPDRLQRARQAISRLIDKLQGDRIGIIVFAGDAYVQLPVTTDYGAAKMFLNTIDTDLAPKQGTAIGAAIDLAVSSFTDTTKKHSAIIVITDGENHEDDAVKSARDAADQGIKVYTIGMGSEQGAPIPILNNGARVGFRQDKSGKTVITRLDATKLSEIADAGNGRFIRATNSDDGLDDILKELSGLDRKEFKAKMYTDYENQFQYFLGLSLFFLLIEFIPGERKSKWFARINLFGVKRQKNAA